MVDEVKYRKVEFWDAGNFGKSREFLEENLTDSTYQKIIVLMSALHWDFRYPADRALYAVALGMCAVFLDKETESCDYLLVDKELTNIVGDMLEDERNRFMSMLNAALSEWPEYVKKNTTPDGTDQKLSHSE